MYISPFNAPRDILGCAKQDTRYKKLYLTSTFKSTTFKITLAMSYFVDKHDMKNCTSIHILTKITD